MKKTFTIIAVLCIAAMALALTACGGGSQPAATTAAAPAETVAATETATQAATEAAAPAETQADAATEAAAPAASGDLSNPSITIAYGDADAISDLGKKAQNFEIEEGTVVQISGIFNSGISTPAIHEQKAEGETVGINMYVDGEWEAPADGTDIDVVGTFVKGQYFMEFHVTPDNITVK